MAPLKLVAVVFHSPTWQHSFCLLATEKITNNNCEGADALDEMSPELAGWEKMQIKYRIRVQYARSTSLVPTSVSCIPLRTPSAPVHPRTSLPTSPASICCPG